MKPKASKPEPGYMFNLTEHSNDFSPSLLQPGFEVMLRLGCEILCGLVAARRGQVLEFRPWGREPIAIPLRRIREAAPLPAHTWLDRCAVTTRQRLEPFASRLRSNRKDPS